MTRRIAGWLRVRSHDAVVNDRTQVTITRRRVRAGACREYQILIRFRHDVGGDLFDGRQRPVGAAVQEVGERGAHCCATAGGLVFDDQVLVRIPVGGAAVDVQRGVEIDENVTRREFAGGDHGRVVQ